MTGPQPLPDGRHERSRVTRQRAVLAAYRLFCNRGLDVAMADIATEADVSVQTLYVAFRTKAELLRAALQYAVHGDDLPLPPHRRPWFEDMRAEPDPQRALMLLLKGTQGIYDRLGPLAGVFRTSAPEVAAIWEHSERLRWDGMHEVTRVLVQKRRLRSGLTAATATDIVFVLLGPDSYQSFVRLGWTPARWRGWAARTLVDALFGS